MNVDATELPSSPVHAKQPTFDKNNHQEISACRVEGRLSRLRIEDEQPDTVHDAMEGQQPSAVFQVEADGGCEAENIHVNRGPNNTIDLFGGIQHSELNCASSDGESEDYGSEGGESDDEMQDSNEGGELPIQGATDIEGDDQDGNEAAINNLSTVNTAEEIRQPSDDPHEWIKVASHADSYIDLDDEERGIFVDFDEEPDVEDDEEMLTHEQDNEIEEDVGVGFGSMNAFAYPDTSSIIRLHLDSQNKQSFATLNELLSSNNAPGRGLYSVEKVLEHEEGRVAELEEQMRYIEAELQEVTGRKNKANNIVESACATFTKARAAAGISERLWEEYEAFCESLEPKFGNRGGWSVTCFENHSGSYVQWDPDLNLFVESAEMPLGSCNFRCEAGTVKSMGKTEYVVEFWPVANPEPRMQTATTWEDQYPDLYKLAFKAAGDKSRDNTIAKELLQSLPTHNLPFSGGWLFEYVSEPSRTRHPVMSRRWSYRTACRIHVDGRQDQAGIEVKTEFGDQDVKMEDD
ncbi:hypothetical protein N8I77_013071 [Diaporthe amygdali]|uniref:Uncharacterized protein n=1 Tax=Phomopsis amygdali TaxID=1214568 RepID=A0AAD9S322_PHOAM|nr:hypothetical protein N8I77_013071 [Diaporthe amygdali]